MKYPTLADISEMKANGYDPSTVAEAKQRLQRGQVAEQLCQVIETAFAGVTLGRGVGLREAQGLDDYADASTCASYRADDEKEDWQRISAEALNHCHSSLSFFDAEGMRFHLPAYLVADLRGGYHSGLEFCLTHPSESNLGRFTLLDTAQRQAVRAFLLFLLDDRDSEFYRPDILRALREHWAEDVAGVQPTHE